MTRLMMPVTLAVVLAFPAAAQDLRAPSEFESIADPSERSAAIFEEMGKVLTHPRCLNCHPKGDSPTQGDDMHPHMPPVVRGAADFGAPGMTCNTCHGPENYETVGVGGIESVPGHEPWSLAPVEMAWTDMSLGEICTQLKDPERNGDRTMDEIHDHMANDGLVGWGWDPGEGRTPAPGSQQLFGQLTRAWIDTGAACPG
ncbi:Isoquinoline 1-oxidoreductase subunit [Paracoccus sp. R12_1]|uniref:Isoquinoline 1-oxidoreductase subunit n=1 Tax=unclassified Paracoccus (in: a-proteobacteria) TaxID=2688777 RepID=UPI001ADC6C0D|nr:MULTISPECIES: Isoquinoline 1-oxidoreductase subunit [unclassified Paracoccus (in: a-proteobacteria)]MBO9456333.1 Isoquinoline 1-oxidoreductase subunit [Paracoccus sp. R12_2]MBO9487542.1 Isoquinoline 1-oxidoreductase subunit [Paracoccus sp. R12_1]